MPGVEHALQLGYGRVVTTTQESIPLRGRGGDTSERKSDGVLDSLYATCIAFTDESGNTVLIFYMDL